MKNVAFAILVFIILQSLDSYMPVSIRLLSRSIFPSPNGDPDSFYAEYNRKRHARILVAFTITVILGISRWINVNDKMFIALTLMLVSGYILLIVRDMFRASGGPKLP